MKHLTSLQLNHMIEDFPELKMSGNNNSWVLLCPFHFDKRERPQFIIDVYGKKFHCLGCGEKGDLTYLKTRIKDMEENGTLPKKINV